MLKKNILVFEAVDRRRDTAFSVYEILTGEFIYRHDRRISEKAAEFNHFAYAFSDNGDNTDSRGFIVYASEGHFIGNNA